MTYRMTPQRMAILQVLEGNREHPSAEEIHCQVVRNFPTVTLATVYNTLELLIKRGDIKELSIDPKRRRYDPETGRHHHMLCRGCGKVVDINSDYDLRVPEGEREGFSIEGNHIEFYGVCPDCQGGGELNGGVQM